MLAIPSGCDEACIVGIDPGSQTLGTCVLYFSVSSYAITRIEATTYNADALYSKSFIADAHGEKAKRIIAHHDNLLELFNRVQPIMVACESPFYSQRRPSAFGVLTEVIWEIRKAVMAYDCWKSLFTIDPPTIKKAVGALGNADKLLVKAAILKIPEIVKCFQGDLETLDEHSLDSIATAYCQYRAISMS